MLLVLASMATLCRLQALYGGAGICPPNAVTAPRRIWGIWEAINSLSVPVTVIISLMFLCPPRNLPRKFRALLSGTHLYPCSGLCPLLSPLYLILLMTPSNREILSQALRLGVLVREYIFLYSSSSFGFLPWTQRQPTPWMRKKAKQKYRKV